MPSIKHNLKPIFLALFMALSANVQAAPITVLLEAEVFSGEFTGETATGTLTYDDTEIDGIGIESINDADGLDVEFIFFGQLFTESDDIDFPDLPSLDFSDGMIVGFDWVVSEIDADNLTDIIEPGIISFLMDVVVQDVDLGPGGETLISGELSVNDFAPVPVPAALPLFVAGLGLLSRWNRRKA